MNSLKKITLFNIFKGKVLVYAFFIVLHVFLFNINATEWGDSYSLLRSAESLKVGFYPEKEKRPPLFSLFLATRPSNIDPILWGRGVVFVFSILSFIFFDKLISQYTKNKKSQKFALLLFTLNPVYLYWSIRVMSDVPFSFFAILIFYLLSRWKETLDIDRSILLGVLAALAILTRFEGYILFFSLLVGVAFLNSELKLSTFNPKTLFVSLWHKLRFLVPLGLTTLLIILPYWLFRSPLDSKYFGEQEYRKFDWNVIWVYFSSLFFVLGFLPFFYFIFKNIFSYKKTSATLHFIRTNAGMASFLLLEMILILWWPAAVPRLFSTIIPFLVVILVLSYEEFKLTDSRLGVYDYVALVSLLVFLGVTQYFLKLQFLVSSQWAFIFIFILQIIILLFLILRKEKMFLIFSFVSLFVWAFSTIWIHRFVYISLKEASLYAAKNLTGYIIYNDSSGTSDWYLNRSGLNKNSHAGRYDVLILDDISYRRLSKKDPSYILLTNENNTDMYFGIEKRPYLTLIKEFRYNIGGKIFFTDVLKFNKEWQE